MQVQFDEEARRFEIGDVVRAVGTPRLLKIIDRRTAAAHIHIVAEKTVHYKCEWRRPDGTTDCQWYEAAKLEPIR